MVLKVFRASGGLIRAVCTFWEFFAGLSRLRGLTRLGQVHWSCLLQSYAKRADLCDLTCPHCKRPYEDSEAIALGSAPVDSVGKFGTEPILE